MVRAIILAVTCISISNAAFGEDFEEVTSKNWRWSIEFASAEIKWMSTKAIATSPAKLELAIGSGPRKANDPRGKAVDFKVNSELSPVAFQAAERCLAMAGKVQLNSRSKLVINSDRKPIWAGYVVDHNLNWFSLDTNATFECAVITNRESPSIVPSRPVRARDSVSVGNW
ncbi:MAG: hypothetical protein HRU19_14405 [Pseudobacteriovorax sp.]|nr:hypothetical protein [Pseudobacteriovorax sp.]